MKRSKKKAAISAYDRLKEVIIADKGGMLPTHMVEVLEQDLLKLLGSYFDILTLVAELNYDKDGRLWLNIESRVDRVKQFDMVETV